MRNSITRECASLPPEKLLAIIDDLVTIFGCVQADISHGGIREPTSALVREISSGRIPLIAVGGFDIFGDSSIG